MKYDLDKMYERVRTQVMLVQKNAPSNEEWEAGVKEAMGLAAGALAGIYRFRYGSVTATKGPCGMSLKFDVPSIEVDLIPAEKPWDEALKSLANRVPHYTILPWLRRCSKNLQVGQKVKGHPADGTMELIRTGQDTLKLIIREECGKTVLTASR